MQLVLTHCRSYRREHCLSDRAAPLGLLVPIVTQNQMGVVATKKINVKNQLTVESTWNTSGVATTGSLFSMKEIIGHGGLSSPFFCI